MATTIQDVMTRAQSLRQETALNSITPERAGGIMYDTAALLNQQQLQGTNPLLISKIYASVEAMEADDNPVSDITGEALRAGQIVVISTSQPDEPDEGLVYRFNGIVEEVSSWTCVGKIGSDPYLEGYQYMGKAVLTPTPTDPGVPTQKVFYQATEPGTYTNFGGIVVDGVEVVNLKWDGTAWSKETTGIATSAKLDRLVHYEKRVDFSGYSPSQYVITPSGLWGTNADYRHLLIPVSPGVVCRVTAAAEAQSFYAFLTSAAAPDPGNAAPLVPGTSRVTLSAGAYDEATAPAGSAYLYVSSGSVAGGGSGVQNLPQSLVLVYEVAEYIKVLDDEQAEFSGTRDYRLSSYELLDYVILDTGNWGIGDYYKHVIIPVTYDQPFHIKANADNQSFYAFLTSKAPAVPGNPAPLVSGTSRVALNAGEEVDIMIPAGCTYLYFSAGDIRNPGYGIQNLPQVVTSGYRIPVVQEVADQRQEISSVLGVLSAREVSVKMELGAIYDGEIVETNAQLVTEDNLMALRSALYYGVAGGDVLGGVETIGADETCQVHFYDPVFRQIGVEAFTPGMVVPQAGYIKLEIVSVQRIPSTHDLRMTIWTKRPFDTWKKNLVPLDAYNPLAFEIKMPADAQNPDDSDYVGNPTRVWDSCRLRLPYNYTRDGASCPLVIFCHGTGGLNFAGSFTYSSLMKIFTKNGFAVADCSGLTAYYKTNLFGNYNANLADSKSNPLLYSCYSALVDFISRDFNVDKDAVFLCSKSAGGLVSSYLAYYAPFKVKAVAAFAPALVMAGQSFRVTDKVALDFWLARLGYASPNVADYIAGAGDMDYVLADYKNLLAFDAFFIGTDIDYLDTLQKMYAIAPTGVGTRSDQLKRAYAANAELMAIFDNARRMLPAPVKIWMAEDDATVPYMWAQKYVDMANRAGCQCFLRKMPDGTGGHHAVDTAASALHTNYLCADGDTIDTPVAWAEAVDWFKQWI